MDGCSRLAPPPTGTPRLRRCREPDDEELEDVCPQDIALKWHAEAASAIYATPLITDLFSDGRKDVVVPSFLHQLEVCLCVYACKGSEHAQFHAALSHSHQLHAAGPCKPGLAPHREALVPSACACVEWASQPTTAALPAPYAAAGV